MCTIYVLVYNYTYLYLYTNIMYQICVHPALIEKFQKLPLKMKLMAD